MYFERDIIHELESRLNNYDLPMLVLGARQIGKTTSIKHYLESSNVDFIYINFENNKDICNLFQENLEPKRIVEELLLKFSKNNVDILFFDEIQECPNALTSLKYFSEDSNVKVIASGSLLGMTLKKEHSSFPVGKVTRMYMYPMSFVEFLKATNKSKLVTEIERLSINSNISTTLHNMLLKEFDLYLNVSGFPKSVESYNNTNNLQSCKEIVSNIRKDYLDDMTKHVSNVDGTKIKNIYNSIDGMLLNENQKFKFSVVDKQGYKRLDVAFDWLRSSYLVNSVYKLSPKTLILPLHLHIKDNEFKLYTNETTLLMNRYDYYMSGTLNKNDNIFKGIVYENYMSSILNKYFEELYYYHNRNTEVDFVIELNSQIIPIEVKSGKRVVSKSFNFFIEKHKIKKAIKISRLPLSKGKVVTNIPVYLIDQLLKQDKEFIVK